MTIFDSHCHIQFKAFDDDREDVIELCNKKNIVMNAVGTQQTTSENAIKLTDLHDDIYATVGLHPIQEYKTKVIEESDSFVSRAEKFDKEKYRSMAKNEKVIAIGETGLDKFHIPKDERLIDIMNTQKDIFLEHYELSKELGIPLVIHVRDAHGDMIDLQKSINSEIKGVMHCFSGTYTDAKKYLDMGLYLGFTGVATFPPKKTDPKPTNDLLEVIKKMPLNKMLIETDSPYLAPQEYRGKRCEPWMVEEVLKKIAEIRQISTQKLSDILLQNSKKLFTRLKFK